MIHLSGKKLIDDMTKDENKKVKDRLISLVATQSIVCVVIIVVAFAFKMIGGDFYTNEKQIYVANFEDETTPAEVISQLSSVVSSNSNEKKESTPEVTNVNAQTDGLDLIGEDDSTACIIDFAEVQTLSSVKMAKNNMVKPLSACRITSEYGYRVNPVSGLYRLHSGIDLGADTGDSIYSVLDGTVIRSDYASDYGHYVVVDHGDGLHTLYAHCSERLVEAGDKVKQGDEIALVGSTGASTGPHLHFEVRVNNERINPLNLLPQTLTA